MYLTTTKQNNIGSGFEHSFATRTSHTGIRDWSKCQQCTLSRTRRRVSIRRDGGQGGIRIVFIGNSPQKVDDLVGIPFMDTKAKLVDALISYVPEPFQWTLTTLVGCMTMTVIGSSEEYDEAEGDIRNLSEGIDYDIWDIGRQPTKAEKQHCAPHISELIETIQPHGIVLLDSTYKTKLPSLTLKLPYDKEYKLLPLLKESHKLTKFITKLYERL